MNSSAYRRQLVNTTSTRRMNGKLTIAHLPYRQRQHRNYEYNMEGGGRNERSRNFPEGKIKVVAFFVEAHNEKKISP